MAISRNKLRPWQERAKKAVAKEWEVDKDSKVLVAACPGAGKTYFAAALASDKLRENSVDVALVVSPSTNIKEQWAEQLNGIGVQAHHRVNNETLKDRDAFNLSMIEDNKAICVTYQQLSRDSELFEKFAMKHRTMLIADEVHHADDSAEFGRALEAVAEVAEYKLALSGTPFNSTGGSLAMCPVTEEIDENGRRIKVVAPIAAYSYGDAVHEQTCRTVEFVKVFGKGVVERRDIVSNVRNTHVIDLARARKTDRIGYLLDPDGEFIDVLLEEGVQALLQIKEHDKRAAMLVVAKDKDHGARLAKKLAHLAQVHKLEPPLEVYNDSPKVHDRIRMLDKDHTDIVVTVRMISEGVDVKRLRVGVYATNYLTKMFFIQFVGRFIRWDDRLGGEQFGKVIIPAHPLLLEYAREIEKMCIAALLKEPDGSDGEAPEQRTEVVAVCTDGSVGGYINRAEDLDETEYAKEFFRKYPMLRGKIPDTDAIRAEKAAGTTAEDLMDRLTTSPEVREDRDWLSKKNDELVAQIVKTLEAIGDERGYGKVQSKANEAVGIVKKDKLTPAPVLRKRLTYLQHWLKSLVADDETV